jgi:3'-5' exoribonuclease
MIIEPLLVTSLALKTKQDGDPYLRLTLVKKDGEECTGVIWEDLEDFQKIIEVGYVYVFEAETHDYQGVTQYTIDAAVKDDNADLSEFMQPCPVDINQAWTDVIKFASSVKSTPYRDVIKTILTDAKVKKKIISTPVTYNLYYSYQGGLIHYLHRCFTWAESLCLLSGDINKDLLFSAILWHNIGKIDEFEISGAIFKQTLKGSLLGAVALSSEIFDQVVRDKGFSESLEIIKLKHCILSSRGSKAMGSPIDPKTREASLLVKVINAVTEIGYYESQTPQDDLWSDYDVFRKKRNYLG